MRAPAPTRTGSGEGPRLKALVTDVDGTLTDVQRRVDPRAVELLHELVRRKVPIILATGNCLPIALGLYRMLGLRGPVVAENGGILYDPSSGSDRVVRLANPAIALQAYRRLRRAGLPVRRLFTDRWRESEVALDTSVPLRRIVRALDGMPVRAEGTGFAIHLMEPNAGKLAGVRRALAPSGLTMRDCLALGDGDNDVDMLSAAGWSVSFPSGSRRAREAADYVTRADYAQGFIEGVKASGILSRTPRRGSDARRTVRRLR